MSRPKQPSQVNAPHYFFLALLMGGVITTIVTTYDHSASAQITPDNTLPSPSAIATDGNITQVTGGTQAGTHLFHSFEDFSITSGQTVLFDHFLTLDTIITRVTGSSISTIEGTLTTQGTTDFFLLNPNGIIFGENAALNVGGSFIASTADRLQFDNGTSFSAVDPQAPPLLTINVPTGLQYGQQPGAIRVNGSGHNLALDADTFEVITSDRPEGLSVNEGQTLALLGGAITLNGGNLTAPSGRVILKAVGNGSALALEPDALGWTTEQTTNQSIVTEWDTITLQNAGSIVTTGNSSGPVQMTGQRIEFVDGSTVIATTTGNQTGHEVRLQASEEIRLSGTLQDSATNAPLFPSSVLAEVAFGATGNGGDVVLSAPLISVRDGAQVSASVFGEGQGGNITANAETIELTGGQVDPDPDGLLLPSGFFLDVADPEATGDGGLLNIQAKQLTLSSGATVSANTFGIGDGGSIRVIADTITLTGSNRDLGPSAIIAQVEGQGNGGSIQVQGDRLRIQNGAGISGEVLGTGQGSTIEINANDLHITGISPDGFHSSISTTVQIGGFDDGGGGNSGTIDIISDQLTITAGGQIRSSTFAEGDAGDINIETSSIRLEGIDNLPTGIFAAVDIDRETFLGGRGDGGQINLITDTLSVTAGAQIVSGTLGPGNANTIQIVADDIVLEGRNNRARSGILASAILDTGNGGSIDIETQSLRIQNGATINASNFASINTTIPAGQGAAGAIHITAENIQLRNQGTITTSTAAGDRGNITLNSDLLTLSDRSQITTDSSGSPIGGNIEVDAGAIAAFNNSDISANALAGFGGLVVIRANGIFGTAFRPELTLNSDITASSALGPSFSGEVILNTPDVDPSRGLVELPAAIVDVSERMTVGCAQIDEDTLILAGAGGIPPTPYQIVQSSSIWSDMRFSEDLSNTTLTSSRMRYPTNSSVIRSEDMPSAPLKEAQGWWVNDQGNLVLEISDRVLGVSQTQHCGLIF